METIFHNNFTSILDGLRRKKIAYSLIGIKIFLQISVIYRNLGAPYFPRGLYSETPETSELSTMWQSAQSRWNTDAQGDWWGQVMIARHHGTLTSVSIGNSESQDEITDPTSGKSPVLQFQKYCKLSLQYFFWNDCWLAQFSEFTRIART